MESDYYPIGAVKSTAWWQDGRLHSDNGPAIQYWNNNGVLIEERWYQRGIVHRDDGPAGIHWDDDGILLYEEWYQRGRRHRVNGPSFRRWDRSGALNMECWFQNDRALTVEEIEKILHPADIMAAIWTLPQPIAEEIAAVYRAV